MESVACEYPLAVVEVNIQNHIHWVPTWRHGLGLCSQSLHKTSTAVNERIGLGFTQLSFLFRFTLLLRTENFVFVFTAGTELREMFCRCNYYMGASPGGPARQVVMIGCWSAARLTESAVSCSHQLVGGMIRSRVTEDCKDHSSLISTPRAATWVQRGRWSEECCVDSRHTV